MLQVMKTAAFGVATSWLKVEPVMVALIGAVLLGDAVSLPMMAAIGVSVLGVVIMTVKPGQGRAVLADGGPALLGLLAGLGFGIAAIGFRGAIVSLEGGGFVLRATTILVLALSLQTTILMIFMALRDRAALLGSLRVWRSSLGAGFLGAFASQCWFIGFALTTAANVRTLALIEVIMEQLVARYWFGQRAAPRQLLGMAVILLGVGFLLRVQA